MSGFADHNQNTKYNMMQPPFGGALKDEQDLDYETKFDPISLNQMQNQYGYDVNEQMMVDIGACVNDPLQFTATFTFANGSNDHSLLDGLSDAVDLSQLLQRLPNDEPNSASTSGNEIDLASTPSITPDSSISITPNAAGGSGGDHGGGMDSFSEQMLLANRNQYFHHSFPEQQQQPQRGNYFSSGKYLDQAPPSYQQRDHHPMMHGHQGMGSGADYIDSHSNLSLPSPGTSSSLDENSPHGLNQLISPNPTAIASTIQNVSRFIKREPEIITETKLELNVLQKRVSRFTRKLQTLILKFSTFFFLTHPLFIIVNIPQNQFCTYFIEICFQTVPNCPL